MSNLEQRLIEDRELRDAARAVLVADIDHAKSSFSAKGVANRVGTRIGDGAVDVFDHAKKKAGSNAGIIAALIGAIILWLGREPLLEAFERAAQDPEPASPETAESVTENDSLDDLEADTDSQTGDETPPAPGQSGDNDEQ